jgi:hypothetical protein
MMMAAFSRRENLWINLRNRSATRKRRCKCTQEMIPNDARTCGRHESGQLSILPFSRAMSAGTPMNVEARTQKAASRGV